MQQPPSLDGNRRQVTSDVINTIGAAVYLRHPRERNQAISQITPSFPVSRDPCRRVGYFHLTSGITDPAEDPEMMDRELWQQGSIDQHHEFRSGKMAERTFTRGCTADTSKTDRKEIVLVICEYPILDII
jgi:hypothetical protein